MGKTKTLCAVCSTPVGLEECVVEHHKVYYHLCTDQCKETFLARPRLYIGKPGAERPVKMKLRTLKLVDPVSQQSAGLITEQLMALKGVKNVTIESNLIHVTYDLLQVTEQRIEERLNHTDAKLGSGWLERLGRAWIHYSEDTELDNMAAIPAPCCNQPPPGT